MTEDDIVVIDGSRFDIVDMVVYINGIEITADSMILTELHIVNED